MKRSPWRTGLWFVILAGLAMVLVRAFQPQPVLVDLGVVVSGPMQVTVENDGITRVRDSYVVTAPIEGQLLRTPLRPGDVVKAKETVLAEFAPIEPRLLDARSRSEAKARIARAEAAVLEMQAMSATAEADLELAQQELSRLEPLVEKKLVSPAQYDVAQRNLRSASEQLRAARQAVEVARFEAEVARASLRDPLVDEIEDHVIGAAADQQEPSHVRDHLRLRSPIDGRVLRVFEESSRALLAGTPLLEVGDVGELEIVTDFLTQDAVKIKPGMPVRLRGWGGVQPDGDEHVLTGTVRVVEPGGFTKVSALGVEEQRVNVIIDPDADEALTALGDGYRLACQVVLWEEQAVVSVPAGALFRNGETWQAFVVEDGVARLRAVQLGRRSSVAAQVLDGLVSGDSVVLYPGEWLEDGMRVAVP